MWPAPPSTSTQPGWGEVTAASTSTDDTESFANFIAKMDGHSNLGSVRDRSRALRRPDLTPKMSAPDLRAQLGPAPGELFGYSGVRKPTLLRPLMAERANTIDTGAPQLLTSPKSLLQPSPFSRQEHSTPPSPPSPAATPTAAEQPKKSKGLLRAIRSLGDLRGQAKELAIPAAPVPAMPSHAQTNRLGQPMMRSFSNSSQASLPPGLSNSTSSRHRPKSSKSSIGSVDDLWGSPAQSIAPPTSRRVDSLTRRPAISRNPSSLSNAAVPTRAAHGHKSTLSGSSMNSVRSAHTASSSDLSRSMSDRGFVSSTRSSTDYSDWSPLHNAPATPPTPMSEHGYGSSGGRYYVENGKLTQSNMVDFTPFYALPPSMSQSKSYDNALALNAGSMGNRSHTRKSSLEQGARNRHRLSSTASLTGRTPLDTILGSPCALTFPATLHSPAPLSPMTPGAASTHKVFKLLHPSSNILLRLPLKDLTLAELKKSAVLKFEAAQVNLDRPNGWGLLCSSKSGGAKLITREDEFAQLLDEVAGADKVTLKVIA